MRKDLSRVEKLRLLGLPLQIQSQRQLSYSRNPRSAGAAFDQLIRYDPNDCTSKLEQYWAQSSPCLSSDAYNLRDTRTPRQLAEVIANLGLYGSIEH